MSLLSSNLSLFLSPYIFVSSCHSRIDDDNEDKEENDDEDLDENMDFGINFTVSIRKGESELFFNCTADATLSISNVRLANDKNDLDASTYNGPPFDNLSEDLQVAYITSITYIIDISHSPSFLSLPLPLSLSFVSYK